MLKRNLWSNQEVINILESRKIVIKMDDAKNWDDASYKYAVRHNEVIEQCISDFLEFEADPSDWVAKAYDTETEQIVIISEPLPQ